MCIDKLIQQIFLMCFALLIGAVIKMVVNSQRVKVQQKNVVSLTLWCVPAFKSIALLCGAETTLRCSGQLDFHASLSSQDCSRNLVVEVFLAALIPTGVLS
ncbi:hypothetical protein LINPERHAP2_LOCUS25561 [Linum perenne]